ncbi:MAG: diacylglycerol kinase family protein [Oscillospiraceae bacterium]
MIKKNEMRNLLKSFLFAFKGIAYCIKNERNMRIHICTTILVLLFSFFYKTNSVETALLLISIGLVIANEMNNTAIETLTNMTSPSYNNLAKITKDVAAGAVFISAMVALFVGIIVFGKPKRLLNTLILIATNPVYCSIFVVLIVVSVLFIFNGAKLFGEPKTKIYHMKNFDEKKH